MTGRLDTNLAEDIMFTALTDGLDAFVLWITEQMPPGTIWSFEFNVKALLALLLVSLVAGAVGSLVVSSRMAFFSDALAHCAFAGVAVGFIFALARGIAPQQFGQWITVTMVVWGVAIGLLIAFVHEKTLLPSDTVIGVFFAGALGIGAVITKFVKQRGMFDVERFIFGDPILIATADILWLLLLAVLTVVFLVFCYNPLLFGTFNPSLAESRRVPSRLARYLFIVLLALVVNLCQQTVGILLINGLLIVPGATASCLSRNLRQLLWWSISSALLCGVGGLWLSWEITVRTAAAKGGGVAVGVGGMVLVLSVALFSVATVVGPWLRKRA